VTDTDQAEPTFDEPRVPILIAMAGLPGAGKSTIAEVLSARLGAPIVSVDPIESAILHAGIDDDQPTGLAAYLVAETMAEQVLASGQTVIVDAVNAVEPARLQWRELAKRTGVELRVVEVVCSDLELHKQRLEKRVRNLPHLEEVTWLGVEQSLEDYQEWGGDTASLARVTVDTTDTIGNNVDAALAFVTTPRDA
jgi:predicted kinase